MARPESGAGVITRDTVLARLDTVATPGGGTLSNDTSRLSVAISQGRAMVSIAIAPTEATAWEPVRAAAERALSDLPGLDGALVALTAERSTPAPSKPAAKPKQEPASRPKPFPNLARVTHIIAVASGKGGVGKSTTAVNLALALAQIRGTNGKLKIGLLDADVYGPSLPKLLALNGTPDIIDGRTLEPLQAYGIKAMSIGFLVEADKAMIWRGPMVDAAITQMLRDIAWGDLDVLVVDMPPGTGDAQLALAQKANMTGAVVVSTPQDLALIDARRGVSMFRDVSVPLLGLVENMSYFVCDGCGKRHHVFAHGGARAEAQKLSVPFLGEVPLDADVRERSDQGLPVVVTAPDSDAGKAYSQIADAVWQKLQQLRP